MAKYESCFKGLVFRHTGHLLHPIIWKEQIKPNI